MALFLLSFNLPRLGSSCFTRPVHTFWCRRRYLHSQSSRAAWECDGAAVSKKVCVDVRDWQCSLVYIRSVSSCHTFLLLMIIIVTCFFKHFWIQETELLNCTRIISFPFIRKLNVILGSFFLKRCLGELLTSKMSYCLIIHLIIIIIL